MSSIILNKFEKEKRVLELHLECKTIRDIAKEVHMSFRDISKIIKEYDRKKILESKRLNNSSNQMKRPTISSLAFRQFKDGKKLTAVAIELQIPAKKVLKLWSQFLKLEGMYECYEFYQVFQYELPALLGISSFICKNKIDIKNIAKILKEAIDVYHLQSYHSEIKNEIARLKQIKNNQQYSQNNQLYPLKPLPKPINWNYPIYRF